MPVHPQTHPSEVCMGHNGLSRGSCAGRKEREPHEALSCCEQCVAGNQVG